MPDSDLPGLGTLTGAGTATGDLLHVVDISDTSMAGDGTDKSITAGNLATAITTLGALLTTAAAAAAYQPLDSDLTSIAALTTTTAGRGLLALADQLAIAQYVGTQTLNAQTGTTYTLVAGDVSKLITQSNAGAITTTVPQDSDATFAIGNWCELYQLGAGQITVTAGTGATLRSTPGAKSRAQYSRIFLQKISANTWAASGDLSA